MQTVIVILVVIVAAFFMIRRFYNSVKKGSQSTCGCGCEGCSPAQEKNCSDIESQ